MKDIKSEAFEQEKIRQFCIKKGYIVINITKSNFNGIPDLLILTGNGTHFWCEVKKEDGGFRYPIQQFREKQLQKHGDISFVANGYEDFLEKYNKLIGTT